MRCSPIETKMSINSKICRSRKRANDFVTDPKEPKQKRQRREEENALFTEEEVRSSIVAILRMKNDEKISVPRLKMLWYNETDTSWEELGFGKLGSFLGKMREIHLSDNGTRHKVVSLNAFAEKVSQGLTIQNTTEAREYFLKLMDDDECKAVNCKIICMFNRANCLEVDKKWQEAMNEYKEILDIFDSPLAAAHFTFCSNELGEAGNIDLLMKGWEQSKLSKDALSALYYSEEQVQLNLVGSAICAFQIAETIFSASSDIYGDESLIWFKRCWAVLERVGIVYEGQNKLKQIDTEKLKSFKYGSIETITEQLLLRHFENVVEKLRDDEYKKGMHTNSSLVLTQEEQFCFQAAADNLTYWKKQADQYFSLAVDYVEKNVKDKSRFVGLFISYGAVKMEVFKDLDAAETFLVIGYNFYSQTSFDLLSNLGELYYEKEEYKEAKKYYEEAKLFAPADSFEQTASAIETMERMMIKIEPLYQD